MVTLSQSRWGLRAITLLVWAMAAGSALYWGLKFSSGIRPGPGMAQTPTAVAAIDPMSVARVLGATAPQAAAPASLASRFALQGVIAGAPGGGAALIAIDGQPAKPFRVGGAVEDGLVLKEASARQVILAASRDGPALVILEMPRLSN
jgi:general secretion pathway protein C